MNEKWKNRALRINKALKPVVIVADVVFIIVLLLATKNALSTRFMPQRAASLGVTEDSLTRMQAISAATGIPLARVKITTWTPDTADCVAEYAWDRESPLETREHFPVSVSCADAGKGAPMGLDRMSADWTRQRWNRATVDKSLHAIWRENREKNIAIGILAAEQRIAPDQVAWKIDRATRAVQLTATGRQFLAADVIRNQPAGLELNPQKYLSASAWKEYERRSRAR